MIEKNRKNKLKGDFVLKGVIQLSWKRREILLLFLNRQNTSHQFFNCFSFNCEIYKVWLNWNGKQLPSEPKSLVVKLLCKVLLTPFSPFSIFPCKKLNGSLKKLIVSSHCWTFKANYLTVSVCPRSLCINSVILVHSVYKITGDNGEKGQGRANYC